MSAVNFLKNYNTTGIVVPHLALANSCSARAFEIRRLIAKWLINRKEITKCTPLMNE